MDAKSLPGPLKLGHQVAELLDILHLFLEVLALDEVAQLRVVVLLGDLVQVQQALVDGLLQLESGLDGIQGGIVLHPVGLVHVLEDDPPSPHVLVLDESHAVVALLVRAGLEELGEPGQGDVVTVAPGGLEEEKKADWIN